MKTEDCFTNYFMILVVILFMMLLYIYIGTLYTAKRETPANENFNNVNDNNLLNKDKLLVIQGNTIPDRGGKKIDFDQNDPSFQCFSFEKE